MTELAKTFDPAAIEAKWYAHWERNGQFRPERPDAAPFTIVNPPPNVTGSLHIGHALDNTLQDIIIRYERLRGKDALWVVGTDHAGIATQMVVERRLEAQQDKRSNYSREQFVDKVWEWKRESGGTITGQLRRLGCSMDWSREQFTMDPHFTKAVTKVFVQLHEEGLLYRDKRLVNWDPGLRTAISDLEVEAREVQGKFWHFRYPLADGVTLDDGRDYLIVATTRPETMLADMAVAVNGADPRYASVIGKEIILPITGRRIPIVADDHADPELGSGAVKITPGHDFNDFEVGKRAGITPAQMLNMLDADAKVCQTADGKVPEELIGLERFTARARVVAMMDALGLLAEVEDRNIQTPFGDRSGVVIEPWLTDQWYVDAATLAGPAMAAVRSGAIEIVPKTWEKTWFNWMENIQPWCISRQLWWGHRIPAWYGPKRAPEVKSSDISWLLEEVVFVANDEHELKQQLSAYYGADKEFVFLETEQEYFEWDEARSSNPHLLGEDINKVSIFRDEDVLDTWFSSALWPFATLGWPDEALPLEGEGWVGVPGAADDGAAPPSPQPSPRRGEGAEKGLLAKHYPNDLLVSGFDILFFWNARMAMQGIHFMGDVPWKRMYLHGLVRAADGQKMSKSKGNVVDPLGLIDQYGADALRFFMAAMESQGRDVKMDEKRVEGYRNFATKLWNAVRFAQSNGITASASLAAPSASLAVNKWIIGEVVETLGELDKALADLRFDAAANAIYHFVWDRFCDWYLELIKGAVDAETKAVAGWVIDQILVMLHPFMPFITEELWHAQGERTSDLILARWPAPEATVDAQAKTQIDWLIRLVSDVRAARAELGIPPGARLGAIVNEANDATRARFEQLAPAIARLARLEGWTFDGTAEGGAAQIVIDEATVILPLEGIIDIEAERTRLTKSLQAAQKEAKALDARLANSAFVERAKPEAVEKARADHAERTAEAERLAAALTRLG